MLSKKDILVLVSLASFFLLAGLFIGFFMAKKEPVPAPPDNSEYIRATDSLNVLNKANKDSLKVLYKIIRINDSLTLTNIKKLTHDKNIINNFTPTSRVRYLDSSFKVAGL